MSNPEKLVTREHIINSLREKYGTIEKLNAAWEASFTSFEDMEKPFRAEELSKTAERDLMDETTELHKDSGRSGKTCRSEPPQPRHKIRMAFK